MGAFSRQRNDGGGRNEVKRCDVRTFTSIYARPEVPKTQMAISPSGKKQVQQVSIECSGKQAKDGKVHVDKDELFVIRVSLRKILYASKQTVKDSTRFPAIDP